MSQSFDILSLSKSKKKLLESCVLLLSEHQWGDISIDQIEQAINKTRGAIFHHYKTKDDLFTAAISYLFGVCQMTSKDNDSLTHTFITVLSEKFNVINPEFAFFNILTQAHIRQLPFIKEYYSDAFANDNIKEIEIIGQSFSEAFFQSK